MVSAFRSYSDQPLHTTEIIVVNAVFQECKRPSRNDLGWSSLFALSCNRPNLGIGRYDSALSCIHRNSFACPFGVLVLHSQLSSKEESLAAFSFLFVPPGPQHSFIVLRTKPFLILPW